MSSIKVLELRNISKSYNQKPVLEDFSLTIHNGELIALIGPSGAGKTTLLNIMANIIQPDKGEMLIDGIPSISIKNPKKRAKMIGVMRQQFDLVNQLAVIHNVLAGRLNEWGFIKSLVSLIVPQDKILAEKSLNRVGLIDKIYEKTDNLSGGEQQRVALARILVQNPEIILADEPVSSLDPARADSVLSLMVKLVKEENQTLIASLHSVDHVKKHFTRIIGMRDGKIYFDLPIDKVNDEDLLGLYNLGELN